MSSESLGGNIRKFLLKNPNENYILATYYFETTENLLQAAIGIAKEQSAANWKIVGNESYYIQNYAAKVVEIKSIKKTARQQMPTYKLKTEVYPSTKRKTITCATAKIAFPIINFGASVTNMINAVAGEPHRLGYLSALKLIDLEFPEKYLKRFQGPKFGIAGIRKKLQIKNRSLFCRSGRPAVGLKTHQMVKIAEEILLGGFDIYKDDELTCDTKLSPFKDRVVRMIDMKTRVEKRTGEKKMYIANIIDDNERSMEYYDIAVSNGADAVLVAPALNGYSFVKDLSKKTKIPIFAHNSFIDPATRHPKFGISYHVTMKLARLCGSDFQITPAHFATSAMSQIETQKSLLACMGKLGNIKPSLPIICGGKQAAELPVYERIVGSNDFMIIAATALDEHPLGLQAGAKAFRQAAAAVQKNISLKDYAKSHRELNTVLH